MKRIEIFLMMCIIMCAACKTRKVQTDITKTSKSTDTEQESQVRSVDTSRTIDKTSEQSISLREAENSSVTEFEADSIVQKGDYTVIYPKGKIKSTTTGHVKTTKTQSKQNDINTSTGKSLDSAGTFKQKIKQDSTHKAKIVDAKGSGTTWATWIPIVAGLVLAFALFLVYRYFKK